MERVKPTSFANLIVADDQIEVHDSESGGRVTPKFWAFVDAKAWGSKYPYGWIGVISGDERDPATWLTVKWQSDWDVFGINRHVAVADTDDDHNLRGIRPTQIRPRAGTQFEGWRYDNGEFVRGDAPAPAAEVVRLREAAPVSTFASDYARAQQEKLFEKLGKYARDKTAWQGRTEAAKARKMGVYEKSKEAALARAESYRAQQADLGRQIAEMEAKMQPSQSDDVIGFPAGIVEEPEQWVSDDVIEVWDPVARNRGDEYKVIPKFWVFARLRDWGWQHGDAFQTGNGWLAVREGDERDSATWKTILDPTDRSMFFVVEPKNVRGRKGTPREGWTLDAGGFRVSPAVSPAGGQVPETPTKTSSPSLPPSTFVRDYTTARRGAAQERYGKYATTKKTLQSAAEAAEARRIAARFGSPDALAGEEIERMMREDVGRMSEGLDESEFDERPYLNVFKSAKDAIRGEPDVFSSPPEVSLPRFREEVRKFQAEEPSVRVIRLDTDATYDDFLGGDRVDELAEALAAHIATRGAHGLAEHEVDPNAHEVVRLAQAVAKRGEGARIELPLPDFARGKVRCWREGDEVVCSLRFAAPDGLVRVATAAARRPDLDEASVAEAASRAGLDAVTVLGVLPELAAQKTGQKLVCDLAGAVLAISHREDVMGGSEAQFVTRRSTTNAPLAAVMSLQQEALRGDVEAASEIARMREVAATPRGRVAVAPLLAAADARLAATCARQQPAGVVDRVLRWIGVAV